jgi:hypothetical protein
VFLAAESTLAGGATRSIGTAYNNIVNGEDLVFEFRLPSGLILPGSINYIGVAPVGLDGDFNTDGVVDAADYVLWRNNVGSPENVLNGNGDNSGTVDGGDYTVWKDNFGAMSPGAVAVTASPIPEPSTVALLCVASAGLLWLRRQGSSLR